jgi:hypothetical protein
VWTKIIQNTKETQTADFAGNSLFDQEPTSDDPPSIASGIASSPAQSSHVEVQTKWVSLKII